MCHNSQPLHHDALYPAQASLGAAEETTTQTVDPEEAAEKQPKNLMWVMVDMVPIYCISHPRLHNLTSVVIKKKKKNFIKRREGVLFLVNTE